MRVKSSGEASNVQLNFDFELGKPVAVTFDGGKISSDGGVVLLRQVDNKLKLSEQLAAILGDKRHPGRVKHSLCLQLRQRLYMIGSGHEDANDADHLRFDPAHMVAFGRRPEDALAGASQETLCRLENSMTEAQLSVMQRFLVMLFIARHKKAPEKLVLDMDTTCDEVHGYQQLSFYNGFYSTYCYVPLFIFSEDGFPLAAVLRAGNASPAGYAVEALAPVVAELRKAWPAVRIELRADAAFCTPAIYRFCEENCVTYFIGFKDNHSLFCKIKPFIEEAKAKYEALFGEAAVLVHHKKQKKLLREAWRRKEERSRFSSKTEGRLQEHFEEEVRRIRVMRELSYQADAWTMARRIVIRIDYTHEGPEIRYVVTNHEGGRPAWIYEDKYCQRGQCENWIKELKILKCDRLSCQEFNANQFRLLLHVLAYILLRELRNHLSPSERAISIDTLMLRLIKVGAVVRETARRISLQLAAAFPWQLQYRYTYLRLRLY